MNNIIFGPPGTGKTTYLLDILDKTLTRGVDPDKIGFVSFTRKAVNEAVDRAVRRFNIKKPQLKYFRTLHAMAYYQLGLNNDNILSNQHLQEFSKIVGLPISAQINYTNIEYGLPFEPKTKGDTFLFLCQLARARMVSLSDVYHNDDYEFHYMELGRFNEAYEKYKSLMGLLDFTDMLEQAKHEVKPIQLDTLIIDEAQDLFPLQWHYITPFCNIADNVYIAGDPDQALYEWAGATPDYLLNMEGNKKVLTQSYRVPKRAHKLAIDIINKCNNSYDKSNYRSCDNTGDVIHVNALESVPFDNDESWYLLARNSYLLPQLEDYIRNFGIPYIIKNKPGINPRDAFAIESWEDLRRGGTVTDDTAKKIYDYFKIDKEVVRGYKSLPMITKGNYTLQDLRMSFGLLTDRPWYECFKLPEQTKIFYTGVFKNYYRLSDAPVININTIHGVKGGEADNVFLLTDMAKKSYNSLIVNGDSEHRIYYVGVTRAKNKVYIMQPQGRYFYNV